MYYIFELNFFFQILMQDRYKKFLNFVCNFEIFKIISRPSYERKQLDLKQMNSLSTLNNKIQNFCLPNLLIKTIQYNLETSVIFILYK